MDVPLVLIAAVGRNGAIGNANRLPWRLGSDLRHFRSATMGRPVIMGRKTYASIGRPLEGRHLVVVSGAGKVDPQPGVDRVADLDQALARAAELAGPAGEIMVAGGATIYAQTMGRAARLDLTLVDLEPAADAWFPPIDPAIWREVRRDPQVAGPRDEAAFSFVAYERRSP